MAKCVYDVVSADIGMGAVVAAARKNVRVRECVRVFMCF